MKEDKFGKIHIKKIKEEFILTCPKCGYSYRSGRDPKHKRDNKNRCPMCGYNWYRYNGVDNHSKFTT